MQVISKVIRLKKILERKEKNQPIPNQTEVLGEKKKLELRD